MPNRVGTQVMRAVDAAVCSAAGATFNAIQFFNKRNPNPSFTPKWSDKPLLKSWEKTKPTLGWPRQTDSLCPDCVKEAREAIIHGKKDWRDLMNEKVGEIKAALSTTWAGTKFRTFSTPLCASSRVVRCPCSSPAASPL